MIDADAALWEPIGQRHMRQFRSRYAHWRGWRRWLVDRHPNPLAHRISANKILESIGPFAR